MITNLDQTNWIIAIGAKDQTEYNRIIREQEAFSKAYQKIINTITQVFFYTYQFSVLYNTFWIIIMEWIPSQLPDDINIPIQILNVILTSIIILLFMGTIRSFIYGASVSNKVLASQPQPIQPDEENNNLVNDTQVKRYCEKCNIIKETNIHHCKVCQECIHGLDHHCYFLGNCVGSFNYKYFFSYFTYCFLLSTITLIVLYQECLKLFRFEFMSIKVSVLKLVYVYLSAILVFFMTLTLLLMHIFVLINDSSQLDIKFKYQNLNFPVLKLLKILCCCKKSEIKAIYEEFIQNWTKRCDNGLIGIFLP